MKINCEEVDGRGLDVTSFWDESRRQIRVDTDVRLEEHLKENWDMYFPSRKQRGRMSLILVKSYRKNTVFVFEGDSKFPVCVARIASHLTGERLRNNFVALEKIENLDLPALQGRYPRPLFYGKISDHEVMIQAFVRGQRMGKSIRTRKSPFWKGRFRANISLISNWLMEFHSKTIQNEKPTNKTDISLLCGPIKDKFDDHPGFLNTLSHSLDNTEGRLSFNVFQHGDLHIDNILVRKDGTIAVLDWDLAVPEGRPLWDLLDSSISCARVVVAGPSGDSDLSEHLDITFFDNNDLSRIVAVTINKYVKYLGIDCHAAKTLFLLWLSDRFDDFQMLEYAFDQCEQFPFFGEIRGTASP